jgi:hypothetical protein
MYPIWLNYFMDEYYFDYNTKSLKEIMLKSTYLLLPLPTYHLTTYLPTYFKPTNNFKKKIYIYLA